MSSPRFLKPSQFPPYGHMVAEWEVLTKAPRTPPEAWRGELPYERWRSEIVELLSHVLWPRFDAETYEWRGPATAQMSELTLADFELFKTLRGMIWQNAGLQAEQVNNYHLFQIEDQEDAKDDQGVVKLERSLDTTLRRYLAGVANDAEIEDLASGYLHGLGSKSGNVDLDIKIDMQRPRAYQMSFVLGIEGFTHQHAQSAVTPSMISGHCVESMMGGASAFYRARETGCSDAVFGTLAQHTVDVGDRRVFAGVHYPSDNISSWLTGLLLCPHVCRDTAGAQWLWEAISTRSAVFRVIAAAAAEKDSPYAQPMGLLEQIGRGEIEHVSAALAVAKRGELRQVSG